MEIHESHANRWYAAHDAGSGTLQATALICCIGVVLMISLAFGAMVLAKAKAQTASDSAALVAAQAWQEGNADPCELARKALMANDAVFVSCSIDKDDIIVTAEVAVSITLIPSMTYASRAGPQEC
ncbi:Rv3654c family TadE-like protein [Bifidobacterium aquikefiri]|uniref:Rv3654c family TadE-like protein n=1 Tax=Bifidobacterium aquikefiri TaxID=1653207 RepID=UPI0039ECEB32